MLPYNMPQLREYIDANGINHFAKWFDALNAQAAVKVRTYLARIENGNYSQVKSVGGGVSECRIDFGPGYRVYFAQEGNRLVILLGGDTKKRQQSDIQVAKELWQEYKRRKKEQ
jgi:putative addiction module killer protein